MKTIYMERTLIFMQAKGINIGEIIIRGRQKTTRGGVNYIVIEE
jgi:hypothetical protein